MEVTIKQGVYVKGDKALGVINRASNILFRKGYFDVAYMDTPDFKGARALVKHDVKCKLQKAYYADANYILVVVRIPKYDIGDFAEALDEMVRNMYIIGNSDYEDIANKEFASYLAKEDVA